LESYLRTFLTAISLAILTMPVGAQWLHFPTPGIQRTADGKPNLTAPTPRTADGKPDFTGLWNAPLQIGQPSADPNDMSSWAKEVAQRRAEDFFKARPMFQCLPSGPETFGQSTSAIVWKRILQTQSVIAVLNDDLTYRQIFMDGRALEAAPSPSWMGYSVGRWEGDTLLVDSFGFNDRTWLNDRGLPHTEALRMTERYHRQDVGHLQIEVTFSDPSVYTKPLSFTVNMQLAADTEMLETVCETSSDHWSGRSLGTSAVNVAPNVLGKYVGVYSGFWVQRPRTVEIVLASDKLVAMIDGAKQAIPLVARSETLFESSEGLGYRFIVDASGAVTHVEEIHVSGDYRYERRR
jgi:hypothetical protein